MKFKFLLFCFTFSILLLSSSLFAGDEENRAKELSDIKTQIKKVAKDVSGLKGDKKTLLTELKKLEISYGKSIAHLNSLKQQIVSLKSGLKENERQQKLKQQQIKTQKQGIENQVKAAHAVGKNEKLKLILNQQDIALSGRVMVYYDLFNKARLKKIRAIDRDVQMLAELEAQYRHESELLAEKLVARKQYQQDLDKAKIKRKAVLVKLDQQVQSKSQQLKRLKQSEKKLTSLILRLQQVSDGFPLGGGAVKPFASLKGKLPWPVKGRLLKKFGAKRSESRWDGVLIAAKEGQDVRAITKGQIVYADWLRGYGLLTIIKHDNGYMTLYALNQSLYKKKGDWVDAGTVISTVGVSGGRLNAGLYFGIRKKGKPVDPVKWCRKIRHGKTR